MKLQSSKFSVPAMLTVTLLAFGAPGAFARKAPTAAVDSNQNRIEVAGHVAFDGKGVTKVVTGEHWGRNYVYLSSAGKITVVDVTDASSPKVEGEYRHSVPNGQAEAVVGDAVLIGDEQPASAPRMISIVSFAEPNRPALLRQFSNVTGLLTDSRRGLVYAVNNEGLWILSEKPGRDLQQEKEYDRQLLYNR